MQEFQPSIPGLAGRMFGGAGPSDLRRAHHHQQGARCGGRVPPEAVKCPRCESTNTKFCYYNNYNLSQPRHFCKSCRRYWTKGGVLRNVPVGGGCRKAKRSSSSSAVAASSTPTSTTEAKNPRRALASSPRSTNSGSTSPSPPAAVPSSSNNIAVVTGHRSTTPISSTGVDVAPPAPIFADQAAALASLFAPPPVFSFAAQQPKDEAVRPDADMAAFTSLDVGIFEQFGNASAASAFWNAVGCWTDDVQDPSVYLP